MPETVLTHFPHVWEAEFAQGFLEDAGVPSRIVSDGAAGGQPYVGGLSGASLVVNAGQAEEARTILEMAGVLPDPQAVVPTEEEVLAALSPASRADYVDLTEQLEVLRKKEFRHMLGAVLGVTPAAIIPLVGLAMDEDVLLMTILFVLVVVVEGWRWIRTGKRSRELRIRLAALEEEVDEA